MKKNHHQIYLMIGIFIMLILIVNGRGSEVEPADHQFNEYELKYGEDVAAVALNHTYFSLETGRDIINTIFNFPQHLWNMIFNPNESQMHAFLRDGFAFNERRSEIQVQERIGQSRDESEEIYMLTWQPAEGFVRQSKLIHEPEEVESIPTATYINSDEPLVYIYNSHPAEMIAAPWADISLGEMNIVDLSHVMATVLADHGIPLLVEDRCVNDLLRANNWVFADSYRASRIFLEERIHQYPTLQFFFDIHRDGIPHDIARIDIDGHPYARILFVIGAENPAGYNENYRIARQLHHMLEEQRPGISRGIMISGGIGRNGIYNQDVASTVQLIEIGTVETTVEEAMNTTKVLADVIAEYILNHVE